MSDFGHGPVPEVDSAQARELLVADAVLIDVREPFEWDAGHAPQARHVPLGSVIAELDSFPRDVPVLVICRSGRRSADAANAMRSAGVDARNVAGGMQGWARIGGEVITPEGTPGNVI